VPVESPEAAEQQGDFEPHLARSKERAGDATKAIF
jgi:hypothetical protein